MSAKGSVITVDNWIKILATLTSKNEAYQQAIWPYLIEHLETCFPKDVPQHAEKIAMAVNTGNKKRSAITKCLTTISQVTFESYPP